MTFDVRRQLESEDYDEKDFSHYVEELQALFAESAEAKALEDRDATWVDPFVRYAFDYCGATPATMGPEDVEEVLLDVYPRKVMTEPEDAKGIVNETRAFFKFLEREFKLENAAECIEYLDDPALVAKLERRFADKRSFGPAKALMSMAKDYGYDISTNDGIQAWMKEVNAHPEKYRLPPMMAPSDELLPDLRSLQGSDEESERLNKIRQERKRKKKRAKASKRRNR
jgi:hypothetical protein